MTNETLTRIEQEMSAKVSPENKSAFTKAVIAGEKIMFDPKTHQHMELVKNPASRKDPVGTIAKGVSGLVWVMFMQAIKSWEKKNPGFTREKHDEAQVKILTYMIPAAVVLMTKAIDFAERGLGIPFDNSMIAKITKLMGEVLFKRLGITPDMLNQAVQKGSAEIEQYKREQQGVMPMGVR